MSLINEALKKAQKQRAVDEAAREGKAPPPGRGSAMIPAGIDPPPPVTPPAAPSAAGAAPDARRGARVTRPRLLPVALVLLAAAAVVVVAGWWILGEDEFVIAPEAVTAPAVAETPPEDPETAVSSVKSDEVSAGPLRTTPEGLVGEQSGPAATENAWVADDVRKDARGLELTAMASSDEVAARTVLPPDPESDEDPGVRSASPPALPEARVDAVVMGDAVLPTMSNAGSAGMDPGGAMQKSDSEVGAGDVLILQDDAPAVAAVQTSGASGAMGPDARVLAFLEAARVAGVRASSTDAKVLMNNRVYRLNAVVEADLQLRITKIEPRELEFTDARGYVYRKGF